MAPSITLSFAQAGVKAPIHVVTSMSQPPWEPLEMDHVVKQDGEHQFSKTFEVDEGHHQYKFKLGPGDWWALDESKPTVVDGDGNRNNLIIVKHEKETADTAERTSLTESSTQKTVNMPEPIHEKLTHVDRATELHSDEMSDHKPPLFSHESFGEVDTENAIDSIEEFEEPSDHSLETYELEEHGAPLFSHESSMIDDEAPLLKHESMLFDSVMDPESPKSRDSPRFSKPEHDIEQFPTVQGEIMRRLSLISAHLPEDEVVVQGSPPTSPSGSDGHRQRSSSLRASIHSDSFSQLEPIHEAEEDRSPFPIIASAQKTSPDDVLTPPMTPDLAFAESIMEDSSASLDAIVAIEQEMSFDEASSAEHYIKSKPAHVPNQPVASIFGGLAVITGLFAIIAGLARIIAQWQTARASLANKTLRLFYPYAHVIDTESASIKPEQTVRPSKPTIR